MELNTYRLDCFTLRIYSLHNISTPNNISLSNVLISYIHHKSQVSYFFMFCTFYKKKLEVYFTWSLNEKTHMFVIQHCGNHDVRYSQRK